MLSPAGGVSQSLGGSRSSALGPLRDERSVPKRRGWGISGDVGGARVGFRGWSSSGNGWAGSRSTAPASSSGWPSLKTTEEGTSIIGGQQTSAPSVARPVSDIPPQASFGVSTRSTTPQGLPVPGMTATPKDPCVATPASDPSPIDTDTPSSPRTFPRVPSGAVQQSQTPNNVWAQDKPDVPISAFQAMSFSGAATAATSQPGAPQMSNVSQVNPATSTDPARNALSKMPVLPHPRAIGSPKNAINGWYGQRYRGGVLVSNASFITWSDGGLPHMLRFSSIFVCPVTGEKFPSGTRRTLSMNSAAQPTPQTQPQQPTEEVIARTEKTADGQDVTVNWYCKKVLAEHAAAARALDCLSFREHQLEPQRALRFCEEEPYLNSDAPLLPSTAPEKSTHKPKAKKNAATTSVAPPSTTASAVVPSQSPAPMAAVASKPTNAILHRDKFQDAPPTPLPPISSASVAATEPAIVDNNDTHSAVSAAKKMKVTGKESKTSSPFLQDDMIGIDVDASKDVSVESSIVIADASLSQPTNPFSPTNGSGSTPLMVPQSSDGIFSDAEDSDDEMFFEQQQQSEFRFREEYRALRGVDPSKNQPDPKKADNVADEGGDNDDKGLVKGDSDVLGDTLTDIVANQPESSNLHPPNSMQMEGPKEATPIAEPVEFQTDSITVTSTITTVENSSISAPADLGFLDFTETQKSSKDPFTFDATR